MLKVVELALNEVGYKEKASNAQLDSKTANAGHNNFTKYARDLYAAGYYNGNKQGYSYCDVFVDWLFYKTYGAKEGQRIQCQTGELGAGCTYSMQYYKDQNRLDMNPKVGDQIFFRYTGTSGADHTGIVVAVSGDTVTTVEGNSNDMVRKRTYKKNDRTIVGYGHPKFPDEKKTYGIVRYGDSGPTVESIQILLNGLGYNCGKVDKVFGNNTLNAVKKFQGKNGLTIDGEVGPNTYKKLLGW